MSIRTASRSPLISEFEVARQVASPLPIGGTGAAIGLFGTTKDVAGILGVITKKDWKPFFDQYFWGMAMPQ